MFAVPPSPELEAAVKRAQYRDRLANLADEELISIYRESEKKYGDKKIHYILLGSQPEYFYRSAAAVDVLRERHGDKIVDELTGITQPKTLVGKRLRCLSY